MIKKFEISFFFFSVILGNILFLFYELENNFFYFLIFSIVFNIYPYLCFIYKISYMHLFFSIFIWLGFYFKYLCVEIIYGGHYPETPLEAYSVSVKNSALATSSLACSALIFSLIFFIKFPLKKKDKKFVLKKQINSLLENYFVLIFFLLIFLILSIAYLNLKFLIYQKGIINDGNELSFLNIPFKSLLIYGFSSLLCLMIYFYNFSSKKLYFYYLFIFENFFSSISSFSRGMIFNSFSLIITNFYDVKNSLGLKINIKKILILISIILSLFLISLLVVEKYRSIYNFNNLNSVESKKEISNQESYLKNSYIKIFNIVTKRFVGIDSIVILSSKQNLSFEFFYSSLFEEYDNKKLNFFEKEIIGLTDVKVYLGNNVRFLKTPGIIAFIYYSGNYLFLFLSLFLIGIFLSYIETFILYFSYNNIYLCSLLSQVIVYRLMHFGINPFKSLLFFVPIIFILLISFLITRFFNDDFNK